MNLILTLLQNDAVQVALLGLFTAGATALAKVIFDALRALKARILNELNADQLQLARNIAAEAVKYAEKVYAQRGGEEKLIAAMDAADKMLVSYGITISTKTLRTIIEAAVFTEIAKSENPPVPVEVTNLSEGTV